MRVVLVDDSLVIRKRLLDLCNQLHEVDLVGTAASVTEAVAAIRLYRPDVLILDIHLISGTGFDVLTALGGELPAMTVIMITSSAIEPYRSVAARHGVGYLFDKVNEFQCIRDTLETLIAAGKSPQPKA